ncbi:MAG: hypothetical protein EOP87_22735, partial [Verrucomicrobiaceae bacterium]
MIILRSPFLPGSLLLICTATSTLAQVAATWTGGAGNWTDNGKWSTGSFPNSATADVMVDNAPGTASQISFGSPGSGLDITIGRLRIDAGDSIVFPSGKNLLLVPGGFTGAGSLVNHGSLQMLGTFRWGNPAA